MAATFVALLVFAVFGVGILGGNIMIGFALATVMPAWAAVLLALACAGIPWGVALVEKVSGNCTGGCLSFVVMLAWLIGAGVATAIVLATVTYLWLAVVAAVVFALVWFGDYLLLGYAVASTK